MRRFRPLTTTTEIYRAADDCAEWEYPRPILTFEIEGSAWYRWGPDVIFWFNSEDEDLKVGDLHLCVARGSQGKIWGRGFLLGVDVVAQLMGFDIIQIGDCTPDRQIMKQMGELPSRMGYSRHDESHYRKTLGGP